MQLEPPAAALPHLGEQPPPVIRAAMGLITPLQKPAVQEEADFPEAAAVEHKAVEPAGVGEGPFSFPAATAAAPVQVGGF